MIVIGVPGEQNARPVKSRWLVVALALAAAVALAMCVQGTRWWSVEDIGVGPFGSTNCFGGTCKRVGLTWLGGSERWARTGMGAGAACLISTFVLVIVAAAAASRRIPRLAARTALVSLATAAVTGGLFIAQFPGGTKAAVDRGVYLFVAGLVVGVIAAVAVLRATPLPPPPDPAP